MIRYSNTLQLPQQVIRSRIAALDPFAECQTFTSDVYDIHTGEFVERQYYVDIAIGAELDEQVISILSVPVSDIDKWNVIRIRRNGLLKECDWTQLPDAALTLEEKQAWSAYRQALRNLPEDFVSPDEVVFPEMQA